jgi:hypothetical protein
MEEVKIAVQNYSRKRLCRLGRLRLICKDNIKTDVKEDDAKKWTGFIWLTLRSRMRFFEHCKGLRISYMVGVY